MTLTCEHCKRDFERVMRPGPIAKYCCCYCLEKSKWLRNREKYNARRRASYRRLRLDGHNAESAVRNRIKLEQA